MWSPSHVFPGHVSPSQVNPDQVNVCDMWNVQKRAKKPTKCNKSMLLKKNKVTCKTVYYVSRSRKRILDPGYEVSYWVGCPDLLQTAFWAEIKFLVIKLNQRPCKFDFSSKKVLFVYSKPNLKPKNCLLEIRVSNSVADFIAKEYSSLFSFWRFCYLTTFISSR